MTFHILAFLFPFVCITDQVIQSFIVLIVDLQLFSRCVHQIIEWHHDKTVIFNELKRINMISLSSFFFLNKQYQK